MSKGAKPTLRVHKILAAAGLLDAPIIREQPIKAAPGKKRLERENEAKEAAEAPAEAATEAAPAAEAPAETPAEVAPAAEAPAETPAKVAPATEAPAETPAGDPSDEEKK